jgi:hypothetical protein
MDMEIYLNKKYIYTDRKDSDPKIYEDLLANNCTPEAVISLTICPSSNLHVHS